MAKKAKAKAKAKVPKAGKGGRAKFQAPVNTKTGAKGDAATGKDAPAFISKSRMTPGVFLKGLLTECRGFKKNVDSIVGSLRERIAYGKDKKNLHTGVFGWLRKIDNMEASKAAEWHHTYIHYLETSGLMAKIDQGAGERLPLGDKPQVKGEDAEKPDDDGDDDAGESEAESGDAGARGAGIEPATGSAEPPANGAGGAKENVARPRFGQRPQAGISGDDLAKATGSEAAAVKH